MSVRKEAGAFASPLTIARVLAALAIHRPDRSARFHGSAS